MKQIEINIKAEGKPSVRTMVLKNPIIYPSGKSRKVVSYMPKKSMKYREIITSEWIKKYGKSDTTSPVGILIVCYFKPNKSDSKKQQEALIGQPYTKKPDWDNIGKNICDALNGIAYKDDNQIYDATVQKWYAREDKIVITAYFFGEE